MNCQSCSIHIFPPERGGIVIPTQSVPIGAQELDQPIVLESIPGHPGSDLVLIETLKYDSTLPINSPLTDPLRLELLWLNLDRYTTAYIYVSFPPMDKVSSTLPSAFGVFAAMSSFPPLSVAGHTSINNSHIYLGYSTSLLYNSYKISLVLLCLLLHPFQLWLLILVNLQGWEFLPLVFPNPWFLSLK